MSTVEQLIETLQDTKGLLIKTHTNFKKTSQARLTRGYLKTKIQCIEEYWTTFREAHRDLLKVTTKEQRRNLLYFTEDEHNQCEEIYTTIKADMLDILEGSSATPGPSISQTVRSTITDINVKLPRINLPTFSGAYDEWQSFEDTFLSLIHNNASLSDVQKLHYLKSCIAGEAKNAIKHFQVTEKNYTAAWDTLKNRYSHKRLIVNAILKKLFGLKKITTQSPTQLKILIDSTKECINSLNSLQIKTDSWDPLIIFLSVQKLDQDSHKDWETYVSGKYHEELPSFTNLISFLESRIQTLELTTASTTSRDKVKERSYHVTTSQQTCIMCKENHLLCHCKEFGKLNPEKRSEYIREQRLCYNCLSAGHPVYYCKQRSSCRICGRRHHSLLHSFKKEEKSTNKEENKQTSRLSSMHSNVEENMEDPQNISIASHFTFKRKMALLATAVVPVRSSSGQIIILRALIDPGSQASFVSERTTQLLQLKKKSIHGTVTGLGSTQTAISHVVQLEVLSRYEKKFSLTVEAYVLSTRLTTKLPCKSFRPMKHWSHLDGLTLADSKYFEPGQIDILLGVEVYNDILKNKFIKGPPGTPSAQETNLGWILFGNIREEQANKEIIAMHHHLDINIENMLRSMWDIESTDKRNLTADERLCEEIYTATQSRTTDGRYVVKLPFRSAQSLQLFGESRDIALKRLYQLERKLDNNPKLKEEYSKVIEEYLDLGHMEEVPEEEKNNPAIYLPHHSVCREDKETTRVRVVFDASNKDSNNKSLNEELLVGPQLQEDLRSLIMRWRMKPICFVADIQKMYRQILVTKEDADCQRILWRKNHTEEVKEYRLLRVTFGTASAPYLAVRSLMQLAEDEGKEYPEAAKVIREDFYVDDCMSGSISEKEAIELSKQLTKVLEKGGFVLQKWASNSTEFMKEIQPSLRSIKADRREKKECVIKTLGLTWNITTDTFHYNFNLPTISRDITKRTILADIQRLFDPVGWLGAAIILAKIFIQKLWIERLDWDEKINDALKEDWLKLRKSFEELNKVKIERWIHTDTYDIDKINLHGFCDASNKAYCAVVYYRVETMNGEVKTGIIASKTRVAPVKPISLPRLELCGAVLLARLITQIREAMRIPTSHVHAWTDSSVVLSWLFGDPSRWKPFVSNRVVEILDNICNTQWFHVRSKENPADIGSRGQALPQLIENKLWWEGPEWLKESEIEYLRPNVIPTDIEKRKIVEVNVKIDEVNTEKKIYFDKYDSLQELLRVIVYGIRFINSKKNSKNLDTQITTEELENALIKCIRLVQREEYGEEIENLKRKGRVKKNSNLKALNPYLDEKDVLRVGGRLRNANLDENMKHPIILGTKNTLISLIIAEAHQRTLHGGIQLMLCFLRSKYWIIRAKNAVKKCIHKCLVCARQKAANRTQIMGDLPKVRTTPARPFLHSGVDFAGPLQVTISKGRGVKSNKAYIAIFICMATKAIHLELVGDLSSEGFIGAFRRFTARRGRCTHIWSDQGRNFVGANKELVAAWREASLDIPGHLAETLTSDGTQWHFIPPYSPHFGGLWEAGVKSTKFHLKRILTTSLTFEEMTTILCQIEACLNSRPLTPIDTTDPDAMESLTPGHFLIGEAPMIIPSPDLRSINISKLSRWQFTQKLVRDFWHRWQSEYLSRLQERPKWLKNKKEFEVGDIVLLKDEQLPPGKWSLGRIVKKHPGQDNVTRVYSIKSHKDIIQRSVTKICSLPIDKS